MAVICFAQTKWIGPVGRPVVVKTASGYVSGRLRLIQHWVMRVKAETAHMTGWEGDWTRVFFSPFHWFFWVHQHMVAVTMSVRWVST